MLDDDRPMHWPVAPGIRDSSAVRRPLRAPRRAGAHGAGGASGPADDLRAGRAALPGDRTGARAVPVRRADPAGAGAEPRRARAVRGAAPAAGRPSGVEAGDHVASPRRAGRRRRLPGSLGRSGRTRCSCRSTGPGRPANAVTSDATDPVSGMPEFKVCAVSVARADGDDRGGDRMSGAGRRGRRRDGRPPVRGGAVGARPRAAVRRPPVGAEEYEPYNRILLTEVLAGVATLAALRLRACPSGSRCAAGCAARRIDRGSRDGGARRRHALALRPSRAGNRCACLRAADRRTGRRRRGAAAARARPPRHRRLPRRRGARGQRPSRGRARRRGARPRGRVRPAPGAASPSRWCRTAAPDGRTARPRCRHRCSRAALDDLGIRVPRRPRVAEVIAAYGELVAVRLTDGDRHADRPAARLVRRPRRDRAAPAAGLPADRGVVVDADLASPDDPRSMRSATAPQPPGRRAPGLVAPGWEQAERWRAPLDRARRPPSPGPTLDGRREGVRLKAAGARPGHPWCARRAQPAPSDRVMRARRTPGRRHVELVVAATASSGTCVGAPQVAASLSVAFDRRTPLPVDPACCSPSRGRGRRVQRGVTDC